MKNKRSLAGSALMMGGIILLSKLLGLFRDILVAGAYGTTEAAIAYETASKLPITLFDFVLGGVVTSAFIPIYNSIAVKKNKSKALDFARSYVNLILALTAALTVIGIVFAPWLISVIAPEISEYAADLAVYLTRIMFPMVIFVGLAFSFVGFLQSEGEYNIPAVISLVSNLIMVAYLVFFSDKFGVVGLSVAMLIGWAAQAAIQLPSVIKRGFTYRLTAPLNTPEIGRAIRNTLPILIATWTTPLCNIINTSVASGIENGRAITALGYSNRLYTILVGLFSFVATNLLFPYFARAAASGDHNESDRLTRTSIKTLVFIIAPLSVGVAVLAEPFVKLIYERGTFTSSDSIITAEALGCYAIGMIFAAIGEVLTKAFFAVEKNKLPMVSSIASMTFNVLIVMLLRDSLGIGGIALVSGAATALNMAVNLVFAYKSKLISFVGRDYIDVAKSVFSALAMGVVVFFVNHVLQDAVGMTIRFAISVIAGIVVYVLIVFAVKSEEAAQIRGLFKKFFTKEKV